MGNASVAHAHTPIHLTSKLSIVHYRIDFLTSIFFLNVTLFLGLPEHVTWTLMAKSLVIALRDMKGAAVKNVPVDIKEIHSFPEISVAQVLIVSS